MLTIFKHKHSTGTNELNKIGKALFGNKYLGTYPQDQLPDEIYYDCGNMSLYAIVNVDSAGSRGSHWVAVAGMPNSEEIMIFDSFGRKSDTLLPLLARGGGVIDTEYDKEQKKYELSCGQFSMAWLMFFEKYGPNNAKWI